MKIQNPNTGAEPGAVRDPMIVLIGEKYYMVATSPDFWKGYNPGVKLWSSDDLVHWKFETLAISADERPEGAWCKERFWAPELFAYKGKYYITVAARNDDIRYRVNGMFMAVADNVTGPYKLVSEEPIVEGIDGHFFEDEDGQIYFFYSTADIWMARFDIENYRLLEEPKCILKRGAEGEWDSIGVEGPAVIKRNGIYYMWYSSWTRAYEMGWATTDDLSKPFTKWPMNPVISGMCERFDLAGHNGVFQLKDGRDAISYHANKRGEDEKLCIDLVTYPMESRTPALEIEV